MARVKALTTSFSSAALGNVTVTKLTLNAKCAVHDSSEWASAASSSDVGVVTFDGTFEGFQTGAIAAPGTKGTLALTFTESVAFAWTSTVTPVSWTHTGTAADGSITVAGAYLCDGDYT